MSQGWADWKKKFSASLNLYESFLVNLELLILFSLPRIILEQLQIINGFFRKSMNTPRNKGIAH